MSKFTYQPIFIHGALDDTPMPANAFRVYAHLCRLANRSHLVNNTTLINIGDHCFQHEEPAIGAKARERRAQLALNWLETAGLINIKRNSHGNDYTINPFAAWTIPVPASVGNPETYPLIMRREYDELPIPANAFRVLMHLARRQGNNANCWPGMASIGEQCFSQESRNPQTDARQERAKAAIKLLAAKNLITITYRARATSVYSLTPHDQWRLTDTTPPAQGDAEIGADTPKGGADIGANISLERAENMQQHLTNPPENDPQHLTSPTESPNGAPPEVVKLQVVDLSDSDQSLLLVDQPSKSLSGASRAREHTPETATATATMTVNVEELVTLMMTALEPVLLAFGRQLAKDITGQLAVMLAPRLHEEQNLTQKILGDKYGPKGNPPKPRAIPVDRTHFDARKFMASGLCPAGAGKTPYEVYREVFPNELEYAIITKLTSKIRLLPRWRAILLEWQLRGYRATNIAGLLDVYENGWQAQTQTAPAVKEPKANGYDNQLAQERAAAVAAARNGA